MIAYNWNYKVHNLNSNSQKCTLSKESQFVLILSLLSFPAKLGLSFSKSIHFGPLLVSLLLQMFHHGAIRFAHVSPVGILDFAQFSFCLTKLFVYLKGGKIEIL